MITETQQKGIAEELKQLGYSFDSPYYTIMESRLLSFVKKGFHVGIHYDGGDWELYRLQLLEHFGHEE